MECSESNRATNTLRDVWETKVEDVLVLNYLKAIHICSDV